jgi:type IV pilus assembly protein PilY1
VQWPGALNNANESVDDSWHATLVSRGKAFGATDPNEIVDALTDVLSAIVARKGSAASVSVATGIVTGATFTYQSIYDSTDASGTVLARRLNADFSFDAKPTWDASCILTGGTCATTGTTEVARPDWNTGRQILTSSSNGVGKGVPFRWASLSAAQQALLNTNPQTNTSDGLGSDRLNFIRGARTKEKANGGTFRNRNFLMGAIVDSSAEFVGAPRETYELSTVLPEAASYKTYKQNYASRPGVVYVGANDGMLHALNSNTGVELFAYVPTAVYSRLGQLTNPLYSFENYVDNTPAIRDVYINGSWKSVLIGTLRRGGQGVFALDVTNTPTEGSAGTSVLWDLTDVDDADLGYTYGKPFIARLASGNWAALVPAGYNSQETDARTGSGASVLFVIDIATGSVLRKFNVTTEGGDAASTGLAAPVLTDLDADSVAEFAYAGDLNGNIWRFDLTNASPGSWTVSRLYKPTTAFDRPITAQPRVLRHPTLGIPIVLVGTGKFIEVNDRSPAIPTQAFYGIRDTGTLVNQTDLSTASVIASTSIRKVSSFTAPASGSKGWQILFTDTTNAAGERVISPAGIRQDTNIVFFSTLIPGGTDPCIPGGSSFVMFANALTGGPSTSGVPFFDTNGDGNINSSDDATAQGKYVASLVPGVASVIQQGGGVGAILFPPPPPGTGGAGAGTLKMPVPEWRRHGWREKFIHQ